MVKGETPFGAVCGLAIILAMKNQHLKYQKSLAECFGPIGFKEVKIDDYSIELSNQQSWRIKLEAERYGDGIFRWVIAPDGAEYFVFTLIETFEEIFGTAVELVKSDDWMRFLRDNQQWVFQVPQSYKVHYEALEKIENQKCLDQYMKKKSPKMRLFTFLGWLKVGNSWRK